MILTEKEEQLIDELISITRKKGYREESIEILLMLSCCEPMEKNFGNQEKALSEMIKIVQESKNPPECLTKTLRLAGIDE